MASLSPSVEYTEKNLSFTVSNLPSSITGAVLRAESGPAFVATSITSEAELVDKFGEPTNYNYKDWFNCYNFLQYASTLEVVRPIDTAKATKNTALALAGGDTYMLITFATATWGTLPVAGDILTQTLTSTSTSNATCTIVSATDGGSGVDTAIVKNVQGTWVTGSDNTVAISGTGTMLLTSSPTIIPTKTSVELATYQGWEQANMFNETIAEQTIGSLTVDSLSSRRIGIYKTGTTEWVNLTKLRGLQLTESPSDDEIVQVTDSGTLVDAFTMGGSAGVGTRTITMNQTEAGGMFLWDGWNFATTKLTVVGTIDSGTTATSLVGDESGATYAVASVSSQILTLSGDATGLYKSGETLTITGGDLTSSGGLTVAVDTVQLVTSPTVTNSLPESGFESFLGTVDTIKLAFFNKYVANTQNIGVAVVSSDSAWEQNVSSDVATAWSSIFEQRPSFSDSEFAVAIYKLEDDGSFTLLESHLCSYSATGKDTLGRIIYVENVMLNDSDYVYCKMSSSPSGTDAVVNTGGGALPMLHHSDYDSVYPRSAGDSTYQFPATYDASNYAQGDIEQAFDEISDPDTIGINLFMAHETALNKASSVAVDRRDAVAIVAPFDDAELVSKTSSEGTTYLKNKFGNTDTSAPIFTDYSTYSAVYGNMKYQYDKYNGINRYLPVIGDICGLIAQTDSDLDPWWAAAGTQRGVMKNVIRLAYNPNKAGRDALYTNAINPVVSIAGEGIGLVMGQKTTTGTASALDRLNVRRLMLTIEQAIVKAMRPFMFEFNDSATRNLILGVINPYLSGVKSRRGLYDFLVVCDESNNTAEIIDSNGLIIDIFVKPVKVAEFIQINFLVTRSDANFSELA